MDIQSIVAIGGLVIGFSGMITGFILQLDTKKIKELEKTNKHLAGKLLKALNAIKGYQAIEIEYAEKEGIEVSQYRAKIRKDKQELFTTSFLTPKKIDEMMKELENQ